MSTENEEGFVFVYGTLKKDEGANYKLDKETFFGEFVSESLFRVFGEGFPMAVLSTDGHPLRGEVYSVTQETLRNLDAYEGYPSFYTRSKLIFRNAEDDSRLAAWVYHINDPSNYVFKHPLKPREDSTLVWSRRSNQD